MKKSIYSLAFVLMFLLSNCTPEPIPIQKTDLTFNNPTFTDITITIDGVDKIALSGSSITFTSLEGNSATYHASTSGSTSDGTIIGEELVWDETVDLGGDALNRTLNVGTDFFFLYVRNNGTHTLTNLYVNFGLSSQTNDNIFSIPNDNVKYRIGYYNAFSNTNARMYFVDTPATFVYWDPITLPWTLNQSIELTSALKTAANGSFSEILNKTTRQLIPYKNSGQNVIFDKNSIDVYCK